jgi:adenylate kinase
MPDRYRSILLFGGPGVGKGTQGTVLGSILGLFHCASGDIFRSIDPNSEPGRTFMRYSAQGELVPDDITVKLWAQQMCAWIEEGRYAADRDLLVLDGIPRTADQARIMDQSINVLKIIHLVCPDRETIVQRIKRRALKQNRKDDAVEDVIRNRWSVYDQETKPVIEHYPPDRVVEVNALEQPVEVIRAVLDVIMPIWLENFAPFEE